MDKTCFVVCPIGEEGTKIRKKSDDLFDFIIKPVCTKEGYDVIRADKIFSNDKINDTILEHLRISDLVIADVSENNPNVFYELGFRTATSKPVIQIANEGSKLPFDINSIRTHFYDLSNPRKSNEFQENLSKIIRRVEEENNKRLETINKTEMEEVFPPDFQRNLATYMFTKFWDSFLDDPAKFKEFTNDNEG